MSTAAWTPRGTTARSPGTAWQPKASQLDVGDLSMRKPNDCLQTVRPRAGQTQWSGWARRSRGRRPSLPTAAMQTAHRLPLPADAPPATAEPLPLIQVLLPHLRGCWDARDRRIWPHTTRPWRPRDVARKWSQRDSRLSGTRAMLPCLRVRSAPTGSSRPTSRLPERRLSGSVVR